MSQHNTKLDPFFAKLKADRFFGVRVVDTDNGSTIALNKTAADMGDVEDYFNSLFDSGVKNIVIQGRRKNGTSFKNDGEPVQVSFEVKPEPAPQAPGAPPTHPAAAPPEYSIPGLGSPIPGLNQQMFYHAMDYQRVINDNHRLTLENQNLKDKNEKLREEQLENRFSEAKATGNKEMLGELAGLAGPIIQTIVASKMGGVAPVIPGAPLNGPAGQLSEAKLELIELLHKSDETFAEYLLDAGVGIAKSQEFAQEFTALLNKYETTINP